VLEEENGVFELLSPLEDSCGIQISISRGHMFRTHLMDTESQNNLIQQILSWKVASLSGTIWKGQAGLWDDL
jgi:hypothetical protein